MVECGACARVFLNAAGEEYDPPHCCVTCKVALHSMINDLGCCPWMPVDNYYFCSRNCIEKHNAAVVEAASIESREPQATRSRSGPMASPMSGQIGWKIIQKHISLCAGDLMLRLKMIFQTRKSSLPRHAILYWRGSC
jgi:hypothetical protein